MRKATTPPKFPVSYVSLDDLYAAYRKAKADAFFERELSLHLEFVEYESKLAANMKRLLTRVIKGDWAKDPAILGECVFIAKNIESSDQSKDEFGKTIHTSSRRVWFSQISEEKKPKANFRPVALPSIDWLVLSALWINKAGHKLDSCLSPSIFGSRLRRLKSTGYNHQALGCFAPYAPAYIEWRERGIKTIEAELEDGSSVIALTADLRSFYHSIDPAFLNTVAFRDLIQTLSEERKAGHPDLATDGMSEADWAFTTQAVASMQEWTRLHRGKLEGHKAVGVPIGPSASRVVANLILLAFDRFIEQEVQPLYYGRYVDDIFLVLRLTPEIENGGDVWKRFQKLANASDSSCKFKLSRSVDKESSEERYCDLRISYDKNESGSPRSLLRFAGSKQKAFFVEGLEGKALIETIKHQIRLNGSEWRKLPEVPNFEHDIHSNCLIADANATEPADSLRKADRISIRRLRFALHLRDVEALADDLDVSDWEPIRKSLFQFTLSHLITPPELFTYSQYLPRIFSLAVRAQKWEAASELLKATMEALDLVRRVETVESRLEACMAELARKLQTALCRSLPIEVWGAAPLPSGLKALSEELSEFVPLGKVIAASSLSARAQALLLADLANSPLRARMMHRDAKNIAPVEEPELPEEFAEKFRLPALKGFVRKLHGNKQRVPAGMIFPTRPLTPAEITFFDPSLLRPENSHSLSELIRAVRGTQFGEISEADLARWKTWNPSDADQEEGSKRAGIPYIWIPKAEPQGGTVRVALPCLMINDESWVANVSQQRDPDLSRYTRLTRIINEIVRMPSCDRPDYIVLPELSIKSRWFSRFAVKLEKVNISLIAGIEYEHTPFQGIGDNEVVNSVRVSMVTDYPGYRTHLVYSQNKTSPALHEESELLRVNNKTLVEGKAKKRIIRHGDFQFGILICSELTNIKFRSRLRGNVDALFVPQWNKDVESFSPLVDSTASDLHLFVVQSNNRRYGDCRIRLPHKDQWLRDAIRIKGGIHDYFATGLINYEELRRFQSCHRSPSRPFKPVPDGFEIHPSRRSLPQGEEDGSA